MLRIVGKRIDLVFKMVLKRLYTTAEKKRDQPSILVRIDPL